MRILFGESSMSPRKLLAGCFLAVVAAWFMNSQARAADEPPASAGPLICSGLVPEDAFAAIVVYPKRVFANEALAKFDVKGMAEDLAKQAGVSPMEVEQFIVIVGPPSEGVMPPRPKIEIIGRFSKPHDGAQLAALWMKPDKLEETEVAGHKYFHTTTKNINPMDEPGVCFLDGQTFVMASETWLPKIFAATDAKSMLISALATADPAADATIIFANTDVAKEMISGAMPKQRLPGPLKPVGDLPDLLRAAKLSIRTTPEVSLKLTLLGKDEASAGKLADMIKMAQQMGQAFLPALQAPPGADIPAEQKESTELLLGLAKKLIDGLVPQQEGQKVTVEIGGLGTIDVLVGKLVLPGVMAARAAARRTMGMNNLKQLGLATFGSEGAYGHFPAHAIYSKEGKPLLSWRVDLLPYLDQQELYKQFHLDEPWDSANNKPLIAKMPTVFISPAGKPLAEGQTRYVVPVGKDTIFDGDKGVRIDDIRDGTSNTILILEVGEDKAVTWTKPDDMDFDPGKPMAGLGTIDGATISVVLADGSVHALKKDIDAETFRRLILRNDGQVIDWSKL
jgi:hypothetical protein